jgi:hypothetical protein
MTTPPDPLLTSARAVLRTTRDDMRASIEGLPADALNWRPAPDDTNSIAVLANHALTSTITWLSVAVDEPLPDRDRDSEFEFKASGPGELLAFLDQAVDRCLHLTDKSRTVDWSALRHHWNPDQGPQVFAAWALIHALEHLREHEGQMSLTRQLWEQRSPSP